MTNQCPSTFYDLIRCQQTSGHPGEHHAATDHAEGAMHITIWTNNAADKEEAAHD